MLTVDHNERIAAKDAMAHPYFKTRYRSVQRSKDRKSKKTISTLTKGITVVPEPK
jgi:hypothetical protein